MINPLVGLSDQKTEEKKLIKAVCEIQREYDLALGRCGNRGGSWDPSSHKLFELAEII